MYGMNANNRVALANWLPRIDFILEHPIEQVWPIILDWKAWMNDFRIEHVSGPTDQVGEIDRMSYVDKSGKTTDGGFLLELVEISPEMRLVYRLLPLKESYGLVDSMHGYEVFNLY